jgi:hypothetical protein
MEPSTPTGVPTHGGLPRGGRILGIDLGLQVTSYAVLEVGDRASIVRVSIRAFANMLTCLGTSRFFPSALGTGLTSP